MLSDCLSWVVGAIVAAEIRFELVASQDELLGFLVVGVAAATIQIAIGLITGLYTGRYRSGSFDDFRNLVITTVCAAVLITVPVLVIQPAGLPRPTGISSSAFALALMIGARALHRNIRERALGSATGTQRVILFGAGEAGEQLARSIRRDPGSHYDAVAFLDDSARKRNLRLEGVRVKGTREDLEEVARRTGARTLIVSIASANAKLLNDLAERCQRAEVHMLVLPPVSQLVSHGVGVGDVREVDEADLLGRAVVETDSAAISDMIHGRRVLVTGAGGSIGSELARKLHPFGPAQLILLDRDESALHAVQLSIHGRALLESEDLVLADIRDLDRLDEVFESYRPEIVFHAAALKHLSLLEHSPKEAVKTNVQGTANVLVAAEKHGVDAFINISTDKAADPTSVLGFSKRITERLTAEADARNTGRYLSVRFGNVLGSRGSMLSAFKAQIERGGPVTVTHPDVTRFFMTIPEAVLLVLQASVVGRGGEVLILDMGEPVSIAEVANRLIRHSGRRIDIVYTGLREGEKLHEDLLASGEDGSRPFHSKITHVVVPALSPADVAIDLKLDSDATRQALAALSELPAETFGEQQPQAGEIPANRQGPPIVF